jgi:hypothetical protein
VSNTDNVLQTIEVDPAAARAQIERLIGSKTFETSDAHRRLLQYLAEKSLAGEADRLKEYTIGIEAFGKPDTYDPKQDSIVRLQVGRLRQKLTAYYQTESTGDAVLVTVPKGAFKLHFEHSSPDRPALAAPRPKLAPWVLPAALAVAILWAIAATFLFVRSHRQAERVTATWTPELEQMWQPFLDSNRSLVVCLGTPLFVRIPLFGFFRDPRANDWQEIERSERISAARKVSGDKTLLPSYAFTGAGEATAAFLLGRLLATRREVQLTRSSILSWQQIRDSDVIFLGPPKFNLQLQTTALTYDIVVDPDGVRNLKPKSGEPVFLEDRIVSGRTSEGETYALISRTAGPSGAGDLLIIAGNASADTMAAAEWLTEPWHAAELVRLLRDPSGKIPRHFQVVLKAAFKQGIPVQSSYVFHHVLP